MNTVFYYIYVGSCEASCIVTILNCDVLRDPRDRHLHPDQLGLEEQGVLPQPAVSVINCAQFVQTSSQVRAVHLSDKQRKYNKRVNDRQNI